MASSTCQWIPFPQGQGLRLSGPFKVVPHVLGGTPRTVSLRLRYRTPLTAMLRGRRFIGGERGLAFTLNDSTGVVTLRDDPTPELDRVPNYSLGEDRPGVLVAVVDNQVRKGLGVKEMAVRMPDEAQQTSDLALALTLCYQLEAERNLFHYTNFVLRDLRIAMVRGVRLPAQGRFTLDAVDTLPSGLDKANFWGCKRAEMAAVDD